MSDVEFTCNRCGATGDPPSCEHFAQPWSMERIAEVHRALIRAGLVWTREKPTQPGWYWLRRGDSSMWRVCGTSIVVWVSRSEAAQQLPLYVAYAGSDCDEQIEDVDGWWAGPLELPSGEPWKETK